MTPENGRLLISLVELSKSVLIEINELDEADTNQARLLERGKDLIREIGEAVDSLSNLVSLSSGQSIEYFEDKVAALIKSIKEL